MAKTERPVKTERAKKIAATTAPTTPVTTRTAKPRLTRRKTDQAQASLAESGTNGSNGANGIPTYAIAYRAFELYCARGGAHGHDLDDWLQAESELKIATGH
jgi:hypothetical protein